MHHRRLPNFSEIGQSAAKLSRLTILNSQRRHTASPTFIRHCSQHVYCVPRSCDYFCPINAYASARWLPFSYCTEILLPRGNQEIAKIARFSIFVSVRHWDLTGNGFGPFPESGDPNWLHQRTK